MLRHIAGLLAVLSAVWWGSAQALGLGELEMRSHLNERFAGTIPLSSLVGDEGEGLLINLASNEEFARAGIEPTEYIKSLRFAAKTDGAPRIEVTSKQIAREPVVSFLLEVRGKTGRILREYTILLDPPEAPKSAAAPAPKPNTGTQFFETADESAQRQAAPKPRAATPPPPAAEPMPAPAAAAPSGEPVINPSETGYGPIAQGETLWSIASKLRPSPTVSMDQAMLAIYRANPKAFEGGITGLLKGSVLQVPAAEAMTSVSASAAKAQVAQLRGERPVAPVAKPEPKPAPAPVVEPKPVAPVAEAKPEPKPEPKPELKPEPALVPKPEIKAEAPPPAPVAAPTTLAPAPAEVAPVATAPATPDQAAAAPATPSSEPAPVAAATPPAATPPAAAVVETPAAPAVTEVPVEAPYSDEEPSLLGDLAVPVGGALALLALGGGAWFFVKKRRAEADTGDDLAVTRTFTRTTTVTSAEPAPKASVKSELENLDSQITAESVKPKAAAPAPAPKMEATLAMTAQVPAVAKAAAAATTDFNSTQIIEAEAAKTTSLAEKGVIDITANFGEQTVSIDLGSNDPIAEADFHLAYGFYDEAALALKTGMESEPDRQDIKTKLAEVYYTAGKSVEFQELTEGLKNQLPAAEWQKIAIMGQQLCPDAALYQDLGGDVGAAVDMDFGGDEPAAAPATSAMEFSIAETPAALPDPALDLPASSGLEFKLDTPTLSTPEIDAKHFDLTAAVEAVPSAPAAEPAVEEFRLDDFDLGGAAPEGAPDSDPISTSLNLARAYVDIGENDSARNLLNEVIQKGSAAQQQEAQALLGRIG